MSRFAVGILCALSGACLWGFSGACSQFLLSTPAYRMTPLFMTLVRMLGAGALFVVVLAFMRRETLREMLHDKKALCRLTIFGGAGLLSSQLSYVISVSYTNAGTATVLQSASIVFVMLATCLFARRAPRVLELIALFCAAAATFLIATKGEPGALVLPFEGLVWGLINALTVAFYVMYPRRLFARFGSFAVTGAGMMLGGLCMIGVCVFLAVFGSLGESLSGASSPVAALASSQLVVPSLDVAGVAVFALLILAGTFGAFALYLHGVSIIGGVKGSLLGAAEPASATIIAALWLGTSFSWGDWVGLALMIATIALVAISPQRSGETRPASDE